MKTRAKAVLAAAAVGVALGGCAAPADHTDTRLSNAVHVNFVPSVSEIASTRQVFVVALSSTGWAIVRQEWMPVH